MMRLVLASLVLAMSLGSPLASDAGMEARCTELGTNCICSEPLAATQYVWVDPNGNPAPGGPHYGFPNPSQAQNANDTSPATDKECSQDWGPGSMWTTNTGPDSGDFANTTALVAVTAAQEAAAFNALPAGHSITRMAKRNDQHPLNQGGNMGAILAGGTPTQRVAIRWYQFHSASPAYAFHGDGGCNNDKLSSLQNSGGGFNEQYITFGTNVGPSRDTIGSHLGEWFSGGGSIGPSGAFANFNDGQGSIRNEHRAVTFRGRWHRYEMVVVNRGSGPLRIFFYLKDVTNGVTIPEITKIDTTVQGSCEGPCTFPGFNPGPTISPAINWISNLQHRHLTCAGYRVFTHMLVAAWSTDAGQRIGAATEVEGGGGPPIPSNPPMNLRITEWLRGLFAGRF